MIDIVWQPERKILRQFGFISLVAFPLLACVFALRSSLPFAEAIARPFSIILISLGVLYALLGAINPKLLHYPFIIMSIIGAAIGLVISMLLLAVLFFLIITPIGLFFRLTGRDELRLKKQKNVTSYFIDRHTSREISSYFKQY